MSEDLYAVAYVLPTNGNRYIFRSFKLVDGVAVPVGLLPCRAASRCDFLSRSNADDLCELLLYMGYSAHVIPKFAFDKNVLPAVFCAYFV